MIRPLLLLVALGLAVANPPPLFNCTGLNGVVWNACRSFGVCNGGRHEQIDCPMGTGFSRNQQNCVDIRQADWPCTVEMRDCSGYPRTVHRLAELESGDGRPPCSWYYTCIYGRFVAHQPCPEGMVYSEQRQNCRYQHDVEEPCGPLPRGTEGDGTGDGSNWPQNQGRNNNNNWGGSPNNNNNNRGNTPNNNNNRGNTPNNNNNWGGSPNNNNNNWGGSPNNNNNNRGNTPNNNNNRGNPPNNNNNWGGSPNNNNNNWGGSPDNNNNNNNQNPRNNNNNWSNPNNPNTSPNNNNNNNNNDWDIFNNNNPNNNNNNDPWGNPNTDNNPEEVDDWDGGAGGFGYAGR